jgi:peptide-N-glycosidase F-like protein
MGPSPDVAPDAPPPPPSFCAVEGLPERAFSAGPYGSKRHDVAGDFSLELVDGTTWTLSEKWTGCESYLFVPDTLTLSEADSTSLWASADDLAQLVSESPRNVHYFFVSRQPDDTLADASTSAQEARIDDYLGTLSTEDAAHWRERLHVVRTRAGALSGWVGRVLEGGIGILGFAIDRAQTLRGIGSLSDVNRYDTGAGSWPFDNSLAYAAHEAHRYNYEATRQERFDAEDVTVVSLFSGEVLPDGFADVTKDLPSAAEMAGFDGFEIDVTMRCPNFSTIEYGNCGAWDYIARLSVYDDGSASWIELGRFITSYHREGHLSVDATPMMVNLLAGGSRTFRWSWAPSWNTQPTATWVDLRFTHRNKAYRPVDAAFLWTGGAFNSAYNAAHPPIDVPIPADATRVEIWAIITGHGGATNNCAEFCDHQHEFTINGSVYLQDHPTIGNNEGCAEKVDDGAIPNQWGTWWYGRGGWCPGMQVDPFVVDVTGDVTPGTTATVSYRGLLFGTDPPDDSGDIDMVSYLVFYR